MIQSLLSLLQSFFSNPALVAPTFWVSLACAVAWFSLSAQKYQEITPEEADMLWKSHKQFVQCNSKVCEQIIKGKKLVGFKCHCGFEFTQKRPII